MGTLRAVLHVVSWLLALVSGMGILLIAVLFMLLDDLPGILREDRSTSWHPSIDSLLGWLRPLCGALVIWGSAKLMLAGRPSRGLGIILLGCAPLAMAVYEFSTVGLILGALAGAAGGLQLVLSAFDRSI
jgi:hypothetical protein